MYEGNSVLTNFVAWLIIQMDSKIWKTARVSLKLSSLYQRRAFITKKIKKKVFMTGVKNKRKTKHLTHQINHWTNSHSHFSLFMVALAFILTIGNKLVIQALPYCLFSVHHCHNVKKKWIIIIIWCLIDNIDVPANAIKC